jgi:hypothetical protein
MRPAQASERSLARFWALTALTALVDVVVVVVGHVVMDGDDDVAERRDRDAAESRPPARPR